MPLSCASGAERLRSCLLEKAGRARRSDSYCREAILLSKRDPRMELIASLRCIRDSWSSSAETSRVEQVSAKASATKNHGLTIFDAASALPLKYIDQILVVGAQPGQVLPEDVARGEHVPDRARGALQVLAEVRGHVHAVGHAGEQHLRRRRAVVSRARGGRGESLPHVDGEHARHPGQRAVSVQALQDEAPHPGRGRVLFLDEVARSQDGWEELGPVANVHGSNQGVAQRGEDLLAEMPGGPHEHHVYGESHGIHIESANGFAPREMHYIWGKRGSTGHLIGFVAIKIGLGTQTPTKKIK
jgi:hypothetical protein